MNTSSLAAKGVKPLTSSPAALYGWRLRFNVAHFFTHEGGVGNIEPSPRATDVVWGVIHYCKQEDLSLLDAAEAYGYGYHRRTVTLQTNDGLVEAMTYIGNQSFLDDNRLPSQRYLRILLEGAIESELPESYIDQLRQTLVFQSSPKGRFTPPPGNYPQFTAEMLSQHPQCTALAGHVFDMSNARTQHEFLKSYFSGKDMTVFHLKRMHGSDASDFHKLWSERRLTPEQDQYINEYLHSYQTEYRYCGTML
jgi:hypothetical protein